jgi:tetratricopeptide (TPR) repeat protein
MQNQKSAARPFGMKAGALRYASGSYWGMMMNPKAWCARAGITIGLMVAVLPVVHAAADDCEMCGKASGDAAIAACTRAIGSGRYESHTLAVLYYNRGNEWYEKGDNDRAIADYNETIRLDPNYIKVYINRGNAWFWKGDNDRAFADYNEAIRLNPNDVKAYNNRGAALRIKGDRDGAIADYNEAIRLNPNEVEAYYNRGALWYAKGAPDRAIADFNEAIRLEPKFTVAYINRGIAWHTKGDPDRAIADYNQAIRLDPNYATAYINRGNAWFTKGDNDRAIADYNEAIRLEPNFALAYVLRGRVNLYSGLLPKALADLNQATELDPTDAYAALWLDIVNRRSNVASRLPEAIAQLDMTKWPVPVIRLFLGQMTPEAVLAAAESSNSETKKRQVCEANFYIGELTLLRGSKETAARLFRLAANCQKIFVESDAANAELKALGATP